MKVNIKTVLCATVFILFIGYNVYSSQKKGVISEMALANIEALASGESGASNTGPREEKKCYGGGHKMVCRSINSESCTDSDCY